MRKGRYLKGILWDPNNNISSDIDITDSSLAVDFLINNIIDEALIKKIPISNIYQDYINNSKLIYKVIPKNPNMDFNIVYKSYENYTKLKDKVGLVEVYCFRISEVRESFEMLMKYPENYYYVESLEKENRLIYAEKIISIIKNILNQQLIPVDCGLANFVTNGENVKMPDLDFLLGWIEVSYFNCIWFLFWFEELKKWCPSISVQINKRKYEFNYKKKKIFNSITYNPLKQKYIEEGELLITNDLNENAIEMFNKALESCPNSADCYNNLAVTYWNLNEIEKTTTLLKVALEIEPLNKIYLDNYTEVLQSQNRPYELIELYDELIKGYETEKKSILKENEISLIQQEIDSYTYPSNYAYDVLTLKPKGSLQKRVEYCVKYCPQLFEPCKNSISIGGSLGYMLFLHSYYADKCTGIEPDEKANNIVRKVIALKIIYNVFLFQGMFKEFPKNEIYYLIWLGNVFHYIYVDYGWEIISELSKISSGYYIIEAIFEVEFLKQQTHLKSNWKNEKLMNDYNFKRFVSEVENYFNIISVNSYCIYPINRLFSSFI